MKKIFFKLNIIITLPLLVMLVACEQTVENPELPYKEQLVIRAVLEAGQPVEAIEITKTLPPLENYDYEKALIKDAVGVIKSGDSAYPLVFDVAYGKYFVNNLIPETGKKYTLEVRTKNMLATASTVIPELVDIDSFYYTFSHPEYFAENYWQFTIYAKYKPNPGLAYIGSLHDQSGFDSYFTYEVRKTADTSGNGTISQPIYYDMFEDTTGIVNEFSRYYGKILVFDPQFYNYFITQWEGSGGDDIFGTSGVNVRGNIKGGVGLFIGMASKSKKVKF